MSKTTIQLFASLAGELPAGTNGNALQVDLAECATVNLTLAEVSVPEELCQLIALNIISVPPNQTKTATIAEGDVRSVWSAVSG